MIEQILVELVEVDFLFFLVAEDFDDFKTVDVLLDKAVDCARLALLTDEVLSALACDKLHYEQHNDKHTHRAKREQRRNEHHRNEHTQDGEQVADEVGNTVREQLS